VFDNALIRSCHGFPFPVQFPTLSLGQIRPDFWNSGSLDNESNRPIAFKATMTWERHDRWATASWISPATD
jgi:hypothetical protein